MKKIIYFLAIIIIACNNNPKEPLTINQMKKNIKEIIHKTEIIGTSGRGDEKIKISKEEESEIKDFVYKVNRILLDRNIKLFIELLANNINVTGRGGDLDNEEKKEKVVNDINKKGYIYNVLFKVVENISELETDAYGKSSFYQVLIRRLINEEKNIRFKIAKYIGHNSFFVFQLYSLPESNSLTMIELKKIIINGKNVWRIKGIHSYGM